MDVLINNSLKKLKRTQFSILKPIFLLGTASLLTGCQISYLMKSAYSQINILYHREPISEILKKNNLNEGDRAKLEVTQMVRKFSAEKLGLKVGNSYSTFVQLDRPYVVWAVNASPKWKLEHHLWYFPIIGSVPYKGFPNPEDAKNEAEDLQKEDYDTFVRGVSAYSTLGWFSDPILSSMMKYSEADLVNTIIHESVHATIYIKSNADFNERLASFIGDKGTELFYFEREGENSPHLKMIREENEDQKLFSKFITEEIDKLTRFYETNSSRDLVLRETQFDSIKKRFREEILPQLKTKSQKNFEQIKLNNARLLLYKTYEEDLSDFERLYLDNHKDLNMFLSKVKTLENHDNPSEGLKDIK